MTKKTKNNEAAEKEINPLAALIILGAKQRGITISIAKAQNQADKIVSDIFGAAALKRIKAFEAKTRQIVKGAK
jgi:hypothetical protein